MFCKNVVLKNLTKFKGKQLFQSFFFDKVVDAASNFIEKETLEQVFSCEFCEIFKSTIFVEYLRWLLLAVMLSYYILSLQRITK